MRTVNTACITYNSTYGNYPPLMSDLAPVTAPTLPTSTSADLLDQVLGSDTAQKSGYNFRYTVGAGNASYLVKGDPITVNQTGVRHFFTDQSGVIRFDAAAIATVASSPLQ